MQLERKIVKRLAYNIFQMKNYLFKKISKRNYSFKTMNNMIE